MDKFMFNSKVRALCPPGYTSYKEKKDYKKKLSLRCQRRPVHLIANTTTYIPEQLINAGKKGVGTRSVALECRSKWRSLDRNRSLDRSGKSLGKSDVG